MKCSQLGLIRAGINGFLSHNQSCYWFIVLWIFIKTQLTKMFYEIDIDERAHLSMTFQAKFLLHCKDVICG